MDINCTDPCAYQQDGKCRLSESPASFTSSLSAAAFASACPYFTEPLANA